MMTPPPQAMTSGAAIITGMITDTAKDRTTATTMAMITDTATVMTMGTIPIPMRIIPWDREAWKSPEQAPMTFRDYLKRPEAIYARSFDMIAEEADFSGLDPDRRTLCIRLIHACGMIDIMDDLHWHGAPERTARDALVAGRPILVDAFMVARGVIARRLPRDNPVICTLEHPDVPARAQRLETTRSAAAVDLWTDHLDGAVVAIGNAPTALFRLLELLEDGAPRPAAILAFPVGFVGAVESKQALMDAGLEIPFVTLAGRRGGSALAAAAVNAVIGPSP